MEECLPNELRTNRLFLRQWRAADADPFAKMNADSKVMEHFPALLSREESDASILRIEEHFELRGFGLWAVEVPALAPFVGYVGLRRVPWTAPFTPCVEVGWRLASEFWGHGFATEAALAALDFGFRTLNLDEIVSFTVAANRRSRRVMERISMVHCPQEDFDHPMLPSGHRLSRHVLYRIKRPSSC